MTVHCTCLEVHGEDWGCPSHGVDAVVQRLRDLAAAKHDDLSIGDDAADIIEDLRDRLNAQLSGHRLSAKEGTSNLLRATTAEAEAKAMREALEPFAEAAASYDPEEGDDAQAAWAHDFTIGSLRRARRALGGSNAE